jgi:hypothetical protein
MALDNLIPSELMNAYVITQLQKEQVAANAISNDYASLVANFGDSVKIPSLESLTASDYTKNSSLTYGTLDSAGTILSINQQKYIANSVDFIDNAQAIANITQTVMDETSYALSLAADTYLLQTVFTNGAGIVGGSTTRALGTSTSAISVSADASGVLNYVGRVAQRMDENDVPQAGRWIIVPPWFHNYLVQNKVIDTRGTANDETFANGRVGRVLGFDIRVSNNLTNATAAASHIYAGIRKSVEFADKLINMEIRPLETKFGYGVRGLYVFGAVVSRADTLVKGYITQA